MPKPGDTKVLTTGDGRKITATWGSKGWNYSAPYGPKTTKPAAKNVSPAAARAIVEGVKNVGEGAKSVLTLGKGGSSPAPAANSPSSSGGGASAPAAAPAKPKAPPKPGRVYSKTRSTYKSEQANQPKSYETDEQRKARMDKSAFDWNMSGDDVKKYRKAYLAKHPAAAKAVAKGTMSMGDINMTVRRLKKKGSMGAFGMKSENG
jgi:hypothetical protein